MLEKAGGGESELREKVTGGVGDILKGGAVGNRGEIWIREKGKNAIDVGKGVVACRQPLTNQVTSIPLGKGWKTTKKTCIKLGFSTLEEIGNVNKKKGREQRQWKGDPGKGKS